MNDNGTYKSVGSTVNTDYTIADPDILIVTPKPKTVDNPELARINVEFQANYASQLGSKCSVVVVMTNLLSQDAATRRIYSEGITPAQFFGIALVVGNPLARAIGSFFMGISRPEVETKMFNSVENAVAWLQTIRPE
jgi:hypothetical protein